jgi:tricorn protease
MNYLRLVIAAVVVASATPSVASAETKLLRFPDIHGDRVVFTYAGDLWTAPVGGGTATRLTAHPGVEVFAKFSTDGRWIAFTGQYDGDEQVYVIPASGGEPKQLTFYPARGPLAPRWGYDNQVHGWTRDGRAIVFRSQRDSWSLPIARLYTVSPDGGPAEPLPMPEAGSGDFSPDSARMVYSPRSRDFRSEKRYGGGQANQLYLFDIKTHAATRITDHARPSRDPMWIGSSVYFNSDRDGKFNLYAYDTAARTLAQVTSNKLWDVRWPSTDHDGRIVYELNGELQVFDVKSRQDRPIKIMVPDDALHSRPSRIPVGEAIVDVALSPKGERVLFNARGDVFSVPGDKGPTRNLTASSGAHDKWARWSPDGAQIAFISDISGEEELYLIDQAGTGKPQALTKGSQAMRYTPAWSPDGKYIAFSDKDGRVFVVTVADRSQREVARSTRTQIRDYTWSPRGNHLAFSMPDENGAGSIWIWSATDARLRRITDEVFNEFNPAWAPSGDYLYYLSDHDYQPQISSIEFNYALNRETGIFAMALRKDVGHPFPPENTEVSITKPTSEPSKPAPEPKPTDELRIDFDGLGSRTARVPLPGDNYGGLAVTAGHLLYVVGPAFYYGREPDRQTTLRIYSLKDRKETTLAQEVQGYALSQDGKKIVVARPREWFLYDATPDGEKTRKQISTAGMMYDRVPRQEWTQIFNEVWRRYRDWFYVENMHGFDWAALREQYRPWLEHVRHRADLNYLIGEMISELAVQHAYIEGGDIVLPPRPRVALPGARFELDAESGRFRISKIFDGQNEEPNYRSPLTEIGVDVSAGDYVLAINGEPLTARDDPYRLLRNKADAPVRLTVNRTPSPDGAREVTFTPVTEENSLIYLTWVNANRRRVTELSNGQIGYLHVPDMGNNGIREFIKWYYPQIRKEGLIVDVRANGGGNVSRMLIERLRRELLALGFARTNSEASTYPDSVFIGPMAALLNENSSSDGDIFPAMFRQAGLGPLIGKRSWGGVVGITNRGALIDGGVVNVPEFGFASAAGEWIIEGHGVDPDIEVENDPRAVIQGRDPQLERAVDEVMKKLKEKPVALPKKPAAPVKRE